MREAESTGTKPAKTVVRKNSAQFAAVCQELLQRGLHLRFTAHGKSMQPNILSEDQVVIAPASERELVRGQVAFAQGREGFRIHRLIRDVATGSAAITRGDAGQEQDPAAQQQILGRAIAIVRKGREISLDRPWTPRLHAARAFFRKVRMAVRRRAARGFLLCVPALILLQLLAGAAPVKAVSVTITQTPSVTTVSPGGTITYTDTLTNNSTTQTVNNPTITQVTPNNTTYFTTFASFTAPAGWNCTTPAVGASGTVTCNDTNILGTSATATITVTVNVPVGTPGQTVLTGATQVTSSTTLTGTTSATSPVTVISADLALSQTASPTAVAAGGTVTFTNIITNNGLSTAAAPQLTFATPANTTYQSVTAAGFTCSGVAVGGTGTLTCTATGTLASGSTGTIAIAVGVNAGTATGTVITGAASTTSTTYDPNSANNSASSTATVASADLAVSLSASPSIVAQTGTITYTNVLTNNGPGAAGNPKLVFATPSNTSFLSATPPAGVTCSGVTAGNAGTLTCTSSVSLANGGTSTIPIAVTVNAGAASGTTITGSATVTTTSSDPNPANNTATSNTVTVNTNDLAMTQTAAPLVVASGSNITYTEVVTNNGHALNQPSGARGK